MEGVTTRGTAYLVLDAVNWGPFTTTDGRVGIDAMVAHSWCVAPELYARLVAKLDEIDE